MAPFPPSHDDALDSADSGMTSSVELVPVKNAFKQGGPTRRKLQQPSVSDDTAPRRPAKSLGRTDRRSQNTKWTPLESTSRA